MFKLENLGLTLTNLHICSLPQKAKRQPQRVQTELNDEPRSGKEGKGPTTLSLFRTGANIDSDNQSIN